jgi:cobalt-zinc-cadmium efflux system protein
MLASVAVLIGGLLMNFYKIWWIDSVLTLLIAIYLIIMGWDLLKNSFKVLMLFTPETTSVKAIVEDIQKIDVVQNVHHVHIWQLNEDEIHLEAHIDFNKNITLSEFDIILNEIEELVFHNYDINHINIQPEFGKCDAKDVIVQD